MAAASHGPAVARTPLSSMSAVYTDHAFLFHDVSAVRRVATAIQRSRWFDGAILATVAVNVVCMVLLDVSSEKAGMASRRNDTLRRVDAACLAVYALEFVVRVCATGLCPLPAWLPVPAFFRPDESMLQHIASTMLAASKRPNSAVVRR
jgi:hypothetical protein